MWPGCRIHGKVWERDSLIRAMQWLYCADSAADAQQRFHLSPWSADEEDGTVRVWMLGYRLKLSSEAAFFPIGSNANICKEWPPKYTKVIFCASREVRIAKQRWQALKTLSSSSREFVPVRLQVLKSVNWSDFSVIRWFLLKALEQLRKKAVDRAILLAAERRNKASTVGVG